MIMPFFLLLINLVLTRGFIQTLRPSILRTHLVNAPYSPSFSTFSRNKHRRTDILSLAMTSTNLEANNIIPAENTNGKKLFGMTPKLRKRWITGLSLGLLATLWIFSGSGYFTLGFLLTSVIAQNEYYRMVRNTGIEPASKTGIFSSLMCFVTAALAPQFHEFVIPLAVIQTMLWLLVFNKKAASINEISSTLLGILFLGYMPSFWVRLRALGEISPTLFPLFLQRWGWTVSHLIFSLFSSPIILLHYAC